jgi:hypothetical protein
MTAKQRSELARKAAKARWSKGVRPLPKRVRERIHREIERMTPEEHAREAVEFRKLLSGFMGLYKDRPMS